jgi:hypothetical protein
MEEQVLSIKQMRHLQELGLDTSDASMYWARVCHGSRINDNTKGKWVLSLQKTFQTCGFTRYETFPTYTLQDIMELLPKEVETDTDTYWLTISIYDCKEWYVCYSMSDEFDYYKEFKSKSLLDAAYKMLCWCAENGYLETSK